MSAPCASASATNFELASCCRQEQALHVVALEVNLGAAERAAQTRQVLDRRGALRVAAAGKALRVHGRARPGSGGASIAMLTEAQFGAGHPKCRQDCAAAQPAPPSSSQRTSTRCRNPPPCNARPLPPSKHRLPWAARCRSTCATTTRRCCSRAGSSSAAASSSRRCCSRARAGRHRRAAPGRRGGAGGGARQLPGLWRDSLSRLSDDLLDSARRLHRRPRDATPTVVALVERRPGPGDLPVLRQKATSTCSTAATTPSTPRSRRCSSRSAWAGAGRRAAPSGSARR